MLAQSILALAKLITLLRWALYVLVIFSALILWKPLPTNPEATYKLPHEVGQALAYTNKSLFTIDNSIKGAIPSLNSTIDVVPYIRILIFLILASYLKSISWKLNYFGKYLSYKKMMKRIKKQYVMSGKEKDITQLESKLEEFKTAKSHKDAKTIFDNFIGLKEQMDKLSRYMTFLSIDIVDSTGMKSNEDKILIQYDFLQYKKMLQGIFDKHESISSAWTPDGVMVAFASPKIALAAAKEVLASLERFNKEEKKVKRDFILRCGINAGIVYYDNSLALEEITDRVIDIAGHMQKYAEPGTVFISRPSAEPFAKREQLILIDKKIDDTEVYKWTKESE